jgi:hypothetical protein
MGILEDYRETYGKGLIPIIHCASCGHRFHIVRTRCPRCGSEELRVVGKDGGIVYTYTVIERGLPMRSVVVIVDVDGVKVKGNYVGNVEKLRIGLPVKAVASTLGPVQNIVFTDQEAT